MTTVRTPRLAGILVRLLAIAGAITVGVSAVNIPGFVARRLAGKWAAPKGDVLIVLAAGSIDDEFLDGRSYWRSVYAARVWRQGGFRQVLVSGGSENGRTPVSTVMRQVLIAYGVPEAAIATETRSNSTRENAVLTKEMLARGVGQAGGSPGRLVMLTSDYHIYRAEAVFRAAGLPVEALPFPDVIKQSNDWRQRLPAMLVVAEELVKIAYYRFKGWM